MLITHPGFRRRIVALFVELIMLSTQSWPVGKVDRGPCGYHILAVIIRKLLDRFARSPVPGVLLQEAKCLTR